MSNTEARRVSNNYGWDDDPDGTHMLIPIEEWERRVEEAFKEGYNVGYEDGERLGIADEDIEWENSIARRALAEIETLDEGITDRQSSGLTQEVEGE